MNRKILSAAALAASLGFIALLFTLLRPALAGVASDPGISGSWSGKGRGREFGLVEVSSRRKTPAQLDADIAVDGPDIFIQLSVHASDSPETYKLAGTQGNGHFWATTDGEGAQLLLTGHVVGSGKAMKGIGVAISDGEFVEFAYTLKKKKS